MCLACGNVLIPAASKTSLVGNLFLGHRSAKLACLVFWNDLWQLREREFSTGVVRVVFLHRVFCSCVDSSQWQDIFWKKYPICVLFGILPKWIKSLLNLFTE